jgi:hypothetical protein
MKVRFPKPEVLSALTLLRPVHYITVSKDGRIFMIMVDAPGGGAMGEWRAPRLSRRGVERRQGPRPQPRAGVAVFAADRAGRAVVGAGHGSARRDHGGPKFVAFDLSKRG